MWGLLIVASLLIGPSRSCIPCSQRGREALEKFTTILRSGVQVDSIEAMDNATQFAKAAEELILNYLQDEVKTLDEYTIDLIVSDFEETVNVIDETDADDDHLLDTIVHQFQLLMKKIKRTVEEAEKRRCPNKHATDGNCGLMTQKHIRCKTCENEKIVCAGGPPQNQEYFDKCSCMCVGDKCFDLKTRAECTPCEDLKKHLEETLDCGERDITVREDKDPVLHCNLHWFTRLEGGYKNVFNKITDPEQKITEDSEIHLQKNLKMLESGKYVCTTVLHSGMPVSKITFNVKVTEVPHPLVYTMVPIQIGTTTSIPYIEEFKVDNLPIAVIFAAGTVAFLLFLAISIFMYLRRKMKKPRKIEPL